MNIVVNEELDNFYLGCYMDLFPCRLAIDAWLLLQSKAKEY